MGTIGSEDDIDSLKSTIHEMLDKTEGVMQDETHQNFVIEEELASSTINLKIYFWADTKNYRVAARILRGRIIKRVIEALIAAKFILPGDITEIKLYGGQDKLPLKLRKDPRGRE
jgi:small-conductance mechanosensitive channel